MINYTHIYMNKPLHDFINVMVDINVYILLLGNTHIIHDSFNTCVNAVHILGFTKCTDNI